MKVKDLKPAGYNPRIMTDDQHAMLKKSMKEYGDLSGIVFNRQTGNTVGGHQRVKHLDPEWKITKESVEDKTGTVALGHIETPQGRWAYREVDWPEKKEMQANIAANKHGGVFDIPKLKDMIVEIDDGSFDIELTGFKKDELDDIFGYEGKQGLTDDDAVPDVPEPITKTGDLYILGDHRLLCGDATKKEDVERLMNGKKADMVFTDPPYGVGYDGGMKKRKELKNDHIGTDIYGLFMPIVVNFLKDDGAFYVWYADATATATATAGLIISAQIIWAKNHAQFMSAAKYKGKHEPCFYAHKKGKSAKWYGKNNEVTLWEYDRANKNEYHPTQKPVALAQRASLNSSPKGGIVIDLFLGSGATLIACEKTDRACYGMEIDETYIQVVIERWQDFTNKQAVLLETGETFEQVKRRRFDATK